jgi:glyoxylase-like metal-dependent hydrolase (beta-lactamase superfamily II)
MHRRLATKALLAAIGITGLAALASVNAQQPPAREPVVRAGATTKISEHVYIIPDDSIPGVPNIGFVVGRTGTLVIDTGMGPPNGQTVLSEAQKLSATNKIYLVTTHVHPEHDLGAQAFPASATLIRSRTQVSEIAEEGMRTADAFRSRSEVNRRLLEGAAFRTADTVFDGNYTLDLGGVSVRLIALGPAHTAGDTAISVEGEGVVFSGDLAMRALPAFASSRSSVRQWLTSLDQLAALSPRIVVPSHGPNGDTGYIANYRTYLTRIQQRTAALKREGKTVDQAVETVSAELRDTYPDTARAAGAIRAAYREAP